MKKKSKNKAMDKIIDVAITTVNKRYQYTITKYTTKMSVRDFYKYESFSGDFSEEIKDATDDLINNYDLNCIDKYYEYVEPESEDYSVEDVYSLNYPY